MSESRESNTELIRIVFTTEDVEDIAEQEEIDSDLAMDRALEWAKHIADTASSLVNEQFTSVVVNGQP